MPALLSGCEQYSLQLPGQATDILIWPMLASSILLQFAQSFKDSTTLELFYP